jgi:transposase-like protein
MTERRDPEKVVREIKRKTRRRFSAEEKIRIVLVGLRGEETIAELCRREGISPNRLRGQAMRQCGQYLGHQCSRPTPHGCIARDRRRRTASSLTRPTGTFECPGDVEVLTYRLTGSTASDTPPMFDYLESLDYSVSELGILCRDCAGWQSCSRLDMGWHCEPLVLIKQRRRQYSKIRPHNSLGYRPPISIAS